LRISCRENKIKNYFQNACQIKKNDYFCTRFEKEVIKKAEQVPRHIELTAVLEEILKQIKRE
jgi:hypothetical protein